MTPCISLCVILKCPHMSILRWFVKSILLTFSFGPLSWNRHDVSLNAWSRFDQQRSEKIMWVQLNQIKPLGFDSPSNTSSWRLFFKSSVSYPCFWPQNSFSTYQQMNCSLRILKTLHLVHVRRSSVALQCCDASRIKESSVRSRDRRQSYVNHLLPKNQKHSSGWLSPAQQWNGCCKMQMLRQSSKTLQSLGLTLPRSH